MPGQWSSTSTVPRRRIDLDLDAGHGVACQICHLGPRAATRPGNGAWVGGDPARCCCKEELGHAHRQCAEAWFRIKGDRRCEICGSDAKNITGLEVKNSWRIGMRRMDTTGIW
ncbi:hypothetical protein ZWY2020_046740 [Hordeum vulgare]|nr:hypothetical protein ZWY2020_046740 [Hordeum vulgare]